MFVDAKGLHHTGDELEYRLTTDCPGPQKKRPVAVSVCPYTFRGGSQRPRGPGPPGGGGAHSTGCCEHRLRRHAHSVCIRAVPPCAQAFLDLFHSISIYLEPYDHQRYEAFAASRSPARGAGDAPSALRTLQAAAHAHRQVRACCTQSRREQRYCMIERY